MCGFRSSAVDKPFVDKKTVFSELHNLIPYGSMRPLWCPYIFLACLECLPSRLAQFRIFQEVFFLLVFALLGGYSSHYTRCYFPFSFIFISQSIVVLCRATNTFMSHLCVFGVSFTASSPSFCSSVSVSVTCSGFFLSF